MFAATDTANRVDALYASLSDGVELPADRRAAIEAELAHLTDETPRDGVALDLAHARRFVTAGKAIFTVSNPTGRHYTYKISAKADTRKPGAFVYFVSLLTGCDNVNDYTYLGLLDVQTAAVVLTKASRARFTDDTESVKVIRWALRQVFAGRELPAGYELRHAGRCGRCGRLLTTPESIDNGIGPECLSKMGAF